jgi:hypothetical protein
MATSLLLSTYKVLGRLCIHIVCKNSKSNPQGIAFWDVFESILLVTSVTGRLMYFYYINHSH